MFNKLKKASKIDIVLFLVSFVLIVNIFWTGITYLNNDSYYLDEDDFVNAIMDENYKVLLTQTDYHRVADVEVTKRMNECLAVADYYKAAIFYQSYHDINAEVADNFYEIMIDSTKNTGALSYSIEKINQELGITE